MNEIQINKAVRGSRIGITLQVLGERNQFLVTYMPGDAVGDQCTSRSGSLGGIVPQFV